MKALLIQCEAEHLLFIETVFKEMSKRERRISGQLTGLLLLSSLLE